MDRSSVAKRFESRPLLLRVMAEIGKGRIAEAFLVDKGNFTEGFIDGDNITVNPAHNVVDTLIHECLHRAYPDWTEAYVRNRTTFLRNRMTDDEVQEVYRIYQSIANRRKTAKDISGK